MEEKVAALLKGKVFANDNVEVQKTIGLQRGYMLLSEYNLMHKIACKIFPSESVAKSYAQGDEIIEVEIVRKFK
jgi:hypothetical protein